MEDCLLECNPDIGFFRVQSVEGMHHFDSASSSGSMKFLFISYELKKPVLLVCLIFLFMYSSCVVPSLMLEWEALFFPILDF